MPYGLSSVNANFRAAQHESTVSTRITHTRFRWGTSVMYSMRRTTWKFVNLLGHGRHHARLDNGELRPREIAQRADADSAGPFLPEPEQRGEAATKTWHRHPGDVSCVGRDARDTTRARGGAANKAKSSRHNDVLAVGATGRKRQNEGITPEVIENKGSDKIG